MSFDNCCTCGYAFTKVGDDTPYADGDPIMTIVHGGGQCRSCYLKDGSKLECECGSLMLKTMKFCHECGTKNNRNES